MSLAMTAYFYTNYGETSCRSELLDMSGNHLIGVVL
jgi:hypothetical protein